MAPHPTLARDLMDRGTALFLQALEGVSDAQLEGPTALPGWTGKHVVAHVAANAGALRNLVQWARTGQETPMYSSTTQRDDDIAAGALRPAADLREAAARTAQALAADLATLTSDQWQHEVRTAQGRRVPATEVPWMRTREVMIHAVDLGGPVTFADLPREFLEAVLDDSVAKRSTAADGPPVVLVPSDSERTWAVTGAAQGDPATTVRGALSELAAYSTGRPARGLTAEGAGGATVPDLPRWL